MSVTKSVQKAHNVDEGVLRSNPTHSTNLASPRGTVQPGGPPRSGVSPRAAVASGASPRGSSFRTKRDEAEADGAVSRKTVPSPRKSGNLLAVGDAIVSPSLQRQMEQAAMMKKVDEAMKEINETH